MTSRHPFIVGLVSLLVLSACMAAGLAMARHKALWNDEYYSQEASVEKQSYARIWAGRTPEGNNSPLFYTIQKALSDRPGRDLWHDSEESRILLRIAPVFFMSLGIALIVGYFLALEGIAGAALALVLAMTSYMTWAYWAEARPYAMVFFGTVIQAIALHRYFDAKAKATWPDGVIFSHWFLALTSALSVIQVVAAGIVLWREGRRQLKDVCLYAVLPLAIGFGYRALAIQSRIWFGPNDTAQALFLANVSAGRLQFILLVPIIIWLVWKARQWPVPQGFGAMVAWGWLTLTGYVILFAYMKAGACHEANVCAPVSNRYFMTLTPVGIILMLTVSFSLLRQLQFVWLKWAAWAVILVVSVPRLQKAWNWAVAYRLFDSFAPGSGVSP